MPKFIKKELMQFTIFYKSLVHVFLVYLQNYSIQNNIFFFQKSFNISEDRFPDDFCEEYLNTEKNSHETCSLLH